MTADRSKATVIGPLFRAVRSGYSTQLGVAVLSFATAVLQARLLGATGRGEVVRFINTTGLLVLALGFGLPAAITYFVAVRAVETQALIRSLVRVLVAVAALAILATLTIVNVGARERFFPSQFEAWECSAATASYLVGALVSGWCGAYVMANREFIRVNRAAFLVAAVGTIISGLLLAMRPAWAGPRTIVWLLVTSELIRAALLIMLTRNASRNYQPVDSTARPLRLMLSFSLLTYLGELVQFATYRADMWFVDAFHGASELGIYGLAVTLSQLVWMLPSAISAVLFPHVPVLGHEAALLTWRVAKISLLSSLALSVVGLGMSFILIPIVFGVAFSPVPWLMVALLAGINPYVIAKVIAGYLAGIRALGWNLALSMVALAISLSLYATLIPTYGATGAAWATAVGYSAHTVMIMMLFRWKGRLTWVEMTTSPISDWRALRESAKQ